MPKMKIAVLYEPSDNVSPAPTGRVHHKERRAPGPSRRRRGPDRRHKLDREEVLEALRKNGYDAFFHELRDEAALLNLSKTKADLVFNMVEAFAGDDSKEAHVAAFLELLDLRYTGAGPQAQSCQDCHMPAGVDNDRLGVHEPRIQTQIALVQDQTYPQADHRAPLDGIVGAVNAHFGLERADRYLVERTLLNCWEVGKDDDQGRTWVAATAEWLRPTPPGTSVPLGPTGKRFFFDAPQVRRQVIFRTLKKIGHSRPLLLWLDDLHLASARTFETLTQLHEDGHGLRIMLVATVRTISTGSASCGRSSSMCVKSRTVRSAPSRSDLLTTSTSAISRIPAFNNWTESPLPGCKTTIDVTIPKLLQYTPRFRRMTE